MPDDRDKLIGGELVDYLYGVLNQHIRPKLQALAERGFDESEIKAATFVTASTLAGVLIASTVEKFPPEERGRALVERTAMVVEGIINTGLIHLGEQPGCTVRRFDPNAPGEPDEQPGPAGKPH